jgi:hypothetical protein
MWFQVLSLLIAGLCIGKAIIALAAPKLFYGFRQQQYASERLPWSILIAPTFVVALTLAAWYATFTHYVAWGWVVTGALTFFAVMAVVNLRRWSGHRAALFQAVSAPQTKTRQRVDGGILLFGSLFLALAFFVY